MLCIMKVGEKMNLIINTMLQEKLRIDYMLEKYETLLAGLPKGTISEKPVNGNIYYYLKYRDGKKVVSKYISKKDIAGVREQIEKRRHVEVMIKSLQEEQQLAEKVLEGNI